MSFQNQTTKNKKTKRYLITLILILLIGLCGFLFFKLCIKENLSLTKPSLRENKKEDTIEGLDILKDADEVNYYCEKSRERDYKNLLLKFSSKLELKKYLVKKRALKYNFKWQNKNNFLYLDTKNWDIEVGVKNGRKAEDIRWLRRACKIDEKRNSISCAVVGIKGFILKLKFDFIEEDFFKITLLEEPESTEAKQRVQMLEFFGKKSKQDSHICFSYGKSPFSKAHSPTLTPPSK